MSRVVLLREPGWGSGILGHVSIPDDMDLSAEQEKWLAMSDDDRQSDFHQYLTDLPNCRAAFEVEEYLVVYPD